MGHDTFFSTDVKVENIVHWTHGSWPGGPPREDGANALSGAGSVDTATTFLRRISRVKNLIIESKDYWAYRRRSGSVFTPPPLRRMRRSAGLQPGLSTGRSDSTTGSMASTSHLSSRGAAAYQTHRVHMLCGQLP